MYKKNDNGNIVLYDIDNTLVSFKVLKDTSPLFIQNRQYSGDIYPNYNEIESLKQAKIRGHYVRVHSQGGQDWAEDVVRLLKLEDYVDSIECKPKWYHDDIPADEWMTRFYLEPK